MKHGEIQQLLATTNRWWRDPTGWSRSDPDLREADGAPFAHRPGALDDLAPGGLYVLRGPRRVGKSVAVKRAIEGLLAGGVEPRRILHASVDGWRAGDLGLLVEAARQLMPDEGPRWWFLDEITSIRDGWPDRVKWLRDNDPRFRTDTVVLTGSSASDLTASTKALADRRGRARDPDRVLLPMGFRTFADLMIIDPPPSDSARPRVTDLTPDVIGREADRLIPWLGDLVTAWETYLQVGGFPRAVATHLTLRDRDEALERGLIDVIHGDAFSEATWSRTRTIAFLQRLTLGLGAPCNLSAIAGDIGASHQTVRRRLDDLREAFVTWPCHQEDRLEPNLRAREKIYFTDPVLTRLGPGEPPDLTRLSEQQVGMALARALERERPGGYLDFARVLHHRTETRREVDFVGPDLGGIAIEVKYVDGRWGRDAQTLRATPWRGIVATRSVLDLSDPGVLAVPVPLLAWLIDD